MFKYSECDEIAQDIFDAGNRANDMREAIEITLRYLSDDTSRTVIDNVAESFLTLNKE